MTNLYVLTSRRPGENPFALLKRTCEQITEEDLPTDARKTIVVDGTPDDLELARAAVDDALDWRWFLFEKPPGSFRGGNKLAYWFTITRAHEDDVDSALILEDDLENCRNAVTRALMFAVPADVDLVQFFSAWTLVHAKMHPGLWRVPSVAAGCQAIKFPRKTLYVLATWATGREFQKYTGSDQQLELARRRLGLRLGCHCPDLFQHDGRASAVDAGTMLEGGHIDELTIERARESLEGRTSVTWPGKTFDALRLFAVNDYFR